MGIDELVTYLEGSTKHRTKPASGGRIGDMDKHGKLLHRIAQDLSIVGIEGKAHVYSEVKLFLYGIEVGEADLVILGPHNDIYLVEAKNHKKSSKTRINNARKDMNKKLKKAHRYFWYRFDIYAKETIRVYYDRREDNLVVSRSNINQSYTKKGCETYYKNRFKGMVISPSTSQQSSSGPF